jgi:tetratricopeptide (TPR) repeat protein
MNKLLKTILIFFSGFTLGLLVTIIAIHYYEKHQATAIYYIASKHSEKEKYDMSIALLNQSITKNSKDYSPFYLLGDIYKIKGNTELALVMYKKASKNIKKIQKRIRN